MSIEMPSTQDGDIGTLPAPSLSDRSAPQPVAHGAALQSVFNGMSRYKTLYSQLFDTWQDVVGSHDREPGVVATLDHGALEWLDEPAAGRDWVIQITSSRWKGGTGTGDSYSAYYKYDLVLKEQDEDGDLHDTRGKSCSLRVIPQLGKLNYQDGSDIEYQYGEGTLVRCTTTWADGPDEIEARMFDVLEAVLDVDRDRLLADQHPDSRRIQKAEAHHRFAIGWKRQVIDAIDKTRELIAFGGMTEIEASHERQREGYLEAVLDADRWHLLGFERTSYSIELKCYQAPGWADMDASEPGRHPKLEASFGGTKGDRALPHADEWDDVMSTLRSVVSAHLDWAGVGREQLVADDYQPGPGVPEYEYPHPVGRRQQLRERYEAVSTQVYREALKVNTTAVYDILSVIATEYGASYDLLEERTGLARSTIRHHVARLQETGVVDKVGNPVLVVFPSITVLDEAKEILRMIYPDDVVDDRKERAEERRERREERDDPDDQDDRDQEDVDDDSDRDRSSWEYFRDLRALGPDQLATALEDGHIDDDHVRIRTDPYDWLS